MRVKEIICEYVVSYDLDQGSDGHRDYAQVDKILFNEFNAKRRLGSVWRFESPKDFNTICKELQDALSTILRSGDKVDVFLITRKCRIFPKRTS